jgi:hypothetical protein
MVVLMMLAHNARSGWTFVCPGPEIPHPDGGHHHRPRWVRTDGVEMSYDAQAARGIIFPS